MKIGTTAIGTVAVVVAALLVGSGNAQAVTRQERQRLYIDLLTDEGFDPHVDRDGDITFERKGFSYFIDVSEGDPEFFRVVMPNIWSVNSGTERAKVLLAANYANGKSKGFKVYTVRGNTWASIELFVGSPGAFKGLFPRVMSAMDYGVSNFADRMRE